jgi:TIR domain
MPSLAVLPEIFGFFSYSREDDEEGTLSALRDAIQRELSAQLGRSKTTFRLWQDQEAIRPGKLWESEIKTAIEQSVFFIPIITPRTVNSDHCIFEFEAFLDHQCLLGRTDLVFPLLYIPVPALENEAEWRKDPVLSEVGKRQYVDWRRFRQLDVRTTAVREEIERFCAKIVGALREPLASPEERVERELQNLGSAEELEQQLNAIKKDNALTDEDKSFYCRMKELEYIDRTRIKIQDLMIETINQDAELAYHRDQVYRKLSEPGLKQEYGKLKRSSELLKLKSDRLERESKKYDQRRKLIMLKITSKNVPKEWRWQAE